MSLPVLVLLGWAVVIGVLAIVAVMADLGGPRDRRPDAPEPRPVDKAA